MYSFLFFPSLRSAMVRVVKALDYQARALSSSPGQSDVFESSDKICSLSIYCDITECGSQNYLNLLMTSSKRGTMTFLNLMTFHFHRGLQVLMSRGSQGDRPDSPALRRPRGMPILLRLHQWRDAQTKWLQNGTGVQ